MSYLVDSDWLIDAFVGAPSAVDRLDRLREDGLAVSIISYGELFEGALAHLILRLNLRGFVVSILVSPYYRSTTPSWSALRVIAPIFVAGVSSSPIWIC